MVKEPALSWYKVKIPGLRAIGALVSARGCEPLTKIVIQLGNSGRMFFPWVSAFRSVSVWDLVHLSSSTVASSPA